MGCIEEADVRLVLLREREREKACSGTLWSFPFWMSLIPKVDWRVMLVIPLIPSMIYYVLIIFYFPESPGWIVRQGRVEEANKVLQRLRRRQDVSCEIVRLNEGT